MSTLHLVFCPESGLDRACAMAGEGDRIVLMGEAVYAVLQEAPAPVPMFVMGPHLDQRGLAGRALPDGMDAIDYDGLVQLVAEHPRSQTW